jgi:hypothetical protein
MVNYGKLWKIVVNYGKLWKIEENCQIMENMMIFNGILWGIQQSGAFRTNIS